MKYILGIYLKKMRPPVNIISAHLALVKKKGDIAVRRHI